MRLLGRPTDGAQSRSGPGLVDRLRPVLSYQLSRFVLVGLVNTAFGFGVFVGLQLTLGAHVHYLVVLVVSHVISVLEAYVLHRRLVFRVSGQWWRDLARFWSVYLGALGINMLALPLLVEVIRLPVLPAQAFVTAATAIGSFGAHRVFSFRRPGAAESATPPAPSQDIPF